METDLCNDKVASPVPTTVNTDPEFTNSTSTITSLNQEGSTDTPPQSSTNASPSSASSSSLSSSMSLEHFNPLFVLIPSRIGIDKPNKVYIEHLKAILQSTLSVGILGGKPKASLYFVAHQDDHFVYLDPHIVQDDVEFKISANSPLSISDSNKQTFHCKVPQKMNIASIDPSLAVGFFCKTKYDFNQFIEWHRKLQEQLSITIFSVQESTPDYLQQNFKLSPALVTSSPLS